MKKVFCLVFICLGLGAFTIDDDADVIAQLRERIELFNKRFKRAKVDLFFNQTKYAPGDTAFVRTLYLSANDLKPVSGGQLIYVELFDPQGKRVLRNQLLVSNGFSSNTLIIPRDLEPGIYLLIAYSDWMKNMDPSLFFRQEFTIAGKEKMEHESSTTLEFYPEGGRLVSGVSNNVMIRSKGTGMNSTVTIKNATGEIASTQLDGEGMGEIKFTPSKGERYYADVNNEKKIDLPASSAGFAVEAVLTTTSAIKLNISPSSDIDAQKKYFLAVINGSGILYSRALNATSKTPLEIELSPELPAGVAQAIIIDENQTVWAERTIRIKPKPNVSLSIRQLNKTLSTREKASFEVEVLDKYGNPVQGQAAVRITSSDLFQQSSGDHPVDHLLLYSDISHSFSLKGGEDERLINRYLISQDCPWLDLSRIGDTPKFPALRTLLVSGKASFLQTGKPVADSTLMMFFLQKQTAGYEVYTNQKGEFNCPILFDFPGQDQVFYSATRRGADLRDVTVQLNKTDSLYVFRSSPWKTAAIEDAYGAYEIKKDIIAESYNFFGRQKDRKDSIMNPNFAIEDELQGADMTLKISDYIIFPTMTDLIREVLRSVEYRKIRGRDVIRVYTTGKRPTNDAGPLYVIDGVLTKNPVTFLSLKPADVLTIKLIKDSNKLSKFGSLGANGVIIVLTKNATTKAALLQENSFTLEGMAPRFKGQSGSRKWNEKVPDLRPCLYWGPHEVLDLSGKAQIAFSTSDDIGTYTIEVEGLTNDGIPFSISDTFEVKYTPQ